jgi:hypothetical protein
MEIIFHRRNLIDELVATPPEFGIEVDIRSYGSELVIHHDPFVRGTSFEEWLAMYRHGTLILNVKEEGLEDRLIELMKQKGISNFFFLDQSFPFLIRTGYKGERRCAVRVSEFESIETAFAVAHLIDWVWIDCFKRFPLDEWQVADLKSAGMRLCIVSPELQGRPAETGIVDLRSQIKRFSPAFEAVCTKRPDLWRL